MNNLQRNSIINKADLNKKSYFSSLIEEGIQTNIINNNDLQIIQSKILSLLTYCLKKYTLGDSSSVTNETAEKVMNSNIFVISLYLKTFDCPEDGLMILKKDDIFNIYNNGIKILKRKINVAKQYHTMVLNNRLDIDNHTYDSTIKGGIKGFFKLYNPEFGAQDIHITADYPVFNMNLDLEGIEFILKYLEDIYYENMFCRLFNSNVVNDLLKSYNENYKDITFNIYEQILTTAIGCIIVDKDPLLLNLSFMDRVTIECRLASHKEEDINKLISSAYMRLKEILNLESESLIKYIDKSMEQVSRNIIAAVKDEKLDIIFIDHKNINNNPKINFEFGSRMDDHEFEKLISEINECRYTSDKISIIKEKTHSLSDLDDILLTSLLSKDDIFAILKSVNALELSAIYKKYCSSFEHSEADDHEAQLKQYIFDYIDSLSDKNKTAVKKAAASLILIY